MKMLADLKIGKPDGAFIFRFHDLRHFFASQLIAQGETAAYVRDQMGHSSSKVTFDTYGHLFPGRGKEASARYEKSMADAKVRQKAEASVSNPLAIDGEEAAEETVTN
jgi:integrase